MRLVQEQSRDVGFYICYIDIPRFTTRVTQVFIAQPFKGKCSVFKNNAAAGVCVVGTNLFIIQPSYFAP
jgi:hypothetical protein